MMMILGRSVGVRFFFFFFFLSNIIGRH